MITFDKFPESFTPFSEMDVCSNIISDAGVLVSIGEIVPLLIGKGRGSKPMIWLQALVDIDQMNFEIVVEESISRHPDISIFEEEGVISVKLISSDILVLSQTSLDSISVKKIDLRGLGLNIFGDERGLSVGGVSMNNNKFKGVRAMIGFSGPV